MSIPWPVHAYVFILASWDIQNRFFFFSKNNFWTFEETKLFKFFLNDKYIFFKFYSFPEIHHFRVNLTSDEVIFNNHLMRQKVEKLSIYISRFFQEFQTFSRFIMFENFQDFDNKKRVTIAFFYRNNVDA